MKRNFLGFFGPSFAFLALFNLLLFVIGDASKFTAAVWISYAFIHFAFLLSVILPLVTSGRKDAVRQATVSYLFTGSYFTVAFITGLIFILIAPESSGATKASWVVQVVLLLLFIILIVPILNINANTNRELARQGREAMFIKDAASRVKLLRDSVTDGNLIVELDLLSNTISASPIKSAPGVKELEVQMMVQIGELEDAVDRSDIEKATAMCKKLTRGVKERNRVLQLVSH